MARYYGKWDLQAPQTDAQGRLMRDGLGDPLQTRYLKGVRPDDLRRIRRVMQHFAARIQEEAQATSWPEVEALLGCEHPLDRIGRDHRQYTLERVVKDILVHLTNRRPGGRPHDLTESFILRHNYLVGIWARALLANNPDEDVTIVDDMLIDIVDPDSTPVDNTQRLRGLFE